MLEPLPVVAACLFWLAALHITGLFCATVPLYDKVTSFRTQQFRLPDLRYSGANNPLLLRNATRDFVTFKKSAPKQTAAHANGSARAFQS
ncbi:MAG: hypothetical protein H0W66_11400 [Chthoniobacterales bacterium]|nr:hypothetical protein [Chthoniobacterales bacterium]